MQRHGQGQGYLQGMYKHPGTTYRDILIGRGGGSSYQHLVRAVAQVQALPNRNVAEEKSQCLNYGPYCLEGGGSLCRGWINILPTCSSHLLNSLPWTKPIGSQRMLSVAVRKGWGMGNQNMTGTWLVRDGERERDNSIVLVVNFPEVRIRRLLSCSRLYEANLHTSSPNIHCSFESLLQPLMSSLALTPRRLCNGSSTVL